MKRTILFGLGALAIVAVLTLNVSLIKTGNKESLGLKTLVVMAQSTGESTTPAKPTESHWYRFGVYTLITVSGSSTTTVGGSVTTPNGTTVSGSVSYTAPAVSYQYWDCIGWSGDC